MDRFLLIEWMDAIAPLWTGESYAGQMFIDRWWWELYEELKFELTEYTPMMWNKTVKASR